MDYSGKIPIQGDGRKLLEKAQSIFIQAGYTVSPISGNRIEVSGGLTRVVDSCLAASLTLRLRHPEPQYAPLQGVSRAVFLVSGKTLWVEAEFRGNRKLRNLLLVFLIGFGLVSAVIFASTGLFSEDPWYTVFVIPFAETVLGLVLIPLIFYVYNKWTRNALDTLLEDLQTLGDG
jgi:hypothetical protein